MAEPGVPHSPQDGAQEPEDADLFRDEPAPAAPRRPTWAAPVRPAPEPDHHAHDELIGFTSAAALAGIERRAPEPVPEPEPEIEPEPEVEAVAPEPEAEPVIIPIPEPEPVIPAPTFAAPRKRDPILDPTPEPDEAATPSEPVSSGWSVETPLAAERIAPDTLGPDSLGPLSATPAFSRPSSAPAFGRADQKGSRNGSGDAPEGATGLYTIYALILFAVPTFGVAAVIGLLMVWMRPKPEQHLARSHFEFQTRTLWIAAIAAVVGAVLVAVNLGVFVLVAMAVWVIIRGAWGVMTLSAGKPVANPRTWMI